MASKVNRSGITTKDTIIPDKSPVRVNIFDEIRKISEGSPQSYSWYREQISQYAQKRVIIESIHSLKDLMVPNTGSMYFFEYNPLYAERLNIYDTFPLVYVIRLTNNGFYGANLHYLSTRGRMDVLLSLEKGKLRLPKKTLHSYRFDRLETPLMEINSQDWRTSIFLPVEDFHRK